MKYGPLEYSVGYVTSCQLLSNYDLMEGFKGCPGETVKTSYGIESLNIMQLYGFFLFYLNIRSQNGLLSDAFVKLVSVQAEQVVQMWVVWVLKIYLGCHPLQAKTD